MCIYIYRKTVPVRETVNTSVESYRRERITNRYRTNALFSFKLANKRQFCRWRERVFYLYTRVYVCTCICAYICRASRTGYGQLYAQFGTNEPQRRNSHKPFGENSNATRLSEQFTSNSRGHAMRYSHSFSFDSIHGFETAEPTIRPTETSRGSQSHPFLDAVPLSGADK